MASSNNGRQLKAEPSKPREIIISREATGRSLQRGERGKAGDRAPHGVMGPRATDTSLGQPLPKTVIYPFKTLPIINCLKDRTSTYYEKALLREAQQTDTKLGREMKWGAPC